MCTKKKLKFSIFLIYNLAEKWQKDPAEVYKILDETHILDDYIFVCYDTLHTLGTGRKMGFTKSFETAEICNCKRVQVSG